MPIDLGKLADTIVPNRTVLFFGAGSSIPSGSPSSGKILKTLEENFGIRASSFSLQEASMLAELKSSRRALITAMRSCFAEPRPTGGLLNLPLYEWKSLYTTNFDELLETSYRRAQVKLAVYNTNFDFSQQVDPFCQRLYKLHGSINSDVCDGHVARIVLTQADYDTAAEYRQFLSDRFISDIAGCDLIIIGYSLSDPDIGAVVNQALRARQNLAGAGGSISLILFEVDQDRALLFENRGLKISFGGIDQFVQALDRVEPLSVNVESEGTILPPSARAITVDVRHAKEALDPQFNGMFNGWAATYADIAEGYTFRRAISDRLANSFLKGERTKAVLLGASGVGKTTAARQIMLTLLDEGFLCWEHRADFQLQVDAWIAVAKLLKAQGKRGILLIDDAHMQLVNLNELAERMANMGCTELCLLLVSSRNQWSPRTRSSLFVEPGAEQGIRKLLPVEVDRLIRLVDTTPVIKNLVEFAFTGFSNAERKRRLSERCEADMFVCLKNIFANEKFDDIILREFSGLTLGSQSIYRTVAAMETAGVRVHRQLVIRLLSVPANRVSHLLGDLEDIIHEYTISEKDGTYGWKVRHAVIAEIISRYKFYDEHQLIKLFDDVIDAISPTYDIELLSLREMCNVQNGLPRFADKGIQNRLLRKMISVAPGERVPRHRLIRNLIEICDFEQASTEIRIFARDIGPDGPTARYTIMLQIARARETPGLLTEDRMAILDRAKNLAVAAVDRYASNYKVHSAYCEVGYEIFRLSGDHSVYDDAMLRFRKIEGQYGDQEATNMIRQWERRMTGNEVFDFRNLDGVG